MGEARAGGCAAIALVGEPGIGKTLMLDELRLGAEAAGFDVFAGRGSEFEQDLPFGLVVDALDERLGALRSTAARWLGAETVADVGTVLPSFAPRAGGTREALGVERHRSYEAVRAVMERAAHARPLVLALDDVHWSDPASVELIAHLVRRRVRRSVLAFAYRGRGVPLRLLVAFEAAERGGTLQRLELAPLTLDEAAEMLAPGVPRAVVGALHAECGGNPFYLEQLARVSRTASAVRRDERLAAGRGSSVPSSVRAAIASELRNLTPACLALLEAGSVVGDPFDVDLAAEIADLDDKDALAALDALSTTDLVRETEVPRRLRFRHPIVRRTVYEGMKAGRRLEAHRRAADALACTGAPLAARAHHVERSARVGDEQAVQLLAEAGRAVDSHAPAVAAQWLGAALRLLRPDAPPEQRLRLLTELAQALATTGRLQETSDVLSQARALVRPELPGERARITAMIARAEQGLGRGARARRLLTEALGAVNPSGAEAAALHLELSEVHIMTRDWDAAEGEAATTLELARSLRDRGLELAATAQLAWVGYGPGDVSKMITYGAEAARGIDELADEELVPPLLEAMLRLGYAEVSVDRLADAARHFERGERACRATGHGHLLAGYLVGRAGGRLMEGRLADARDAADAAAETSLALGNDQSRAAAEALRSWIAALQGDDETALAAGEAAVTAAERAPGSMFAWLAKASYGQALIELGRREEGRIAILDLGGAELTSMVPSARPRWWRALVECEIDAGRIDAAERLSERLEGSVRPLGYGSRVGDARLAAAHLRLVHSDWHGAAKLAGEAVESFEAVGWRIDAARARIVAARALERDGDVAASQRELETAHGMLRSCGATRLADRAAQHLRALGRPVKTRFGRAPAAQAGFQQLSRRESEVADRVSRGYTNKQIAEELFVSEKTIEKYLARIFAKLGVSSRAAVAATVARREAAGRE